MSTKRLFIGALLLFSFITGCSSTRHQWNFSAENEVFFMGSFDLKYQTLLGDCIPFLYLKSDQSLSSDSEISVPVQPNQMQIIRLPRARYQIIRMACNDRPSSEFDLQTLRMTLDGTYSSYDPNPVVYLGDLKIWYGDLGLPANTKAKLVKNGDHAQWVYKMEKKRNLQGHVDHFYKKVPEMKSARISEREISLPFQIWE